MDNLIKTYINEPGEYTEFAQGNILIRSEGVTIKDYVGDGVILVGDGVSGEINLSNINTTNEIVLRGGDTILSGKMKEVSLCVDGVKLNWSDFKIGAVPFYNKPGTSLYIPEVKFDSIK